MIQGENIRKAYGDKLLIDDFSFKIPAGAVVGIIGPNGAGKTTLFRMITGQEKPDSGKMIVGDTVKLAYVDQMRDKLDPELSVWETISDGKNETILLGAEGSRLTRVLRTLQLLGLGPAEEGRSPSGGERNRVHLAKTLKAGPETCCSSMNRRTTSTSTRSARSKRP